MAELQHAGLERDRTGVRNSPIFHLIFSGDHCLDTTKAAERHSKPFSFHFISADSGSSQPLDHVVLKLRELEAGIMK